MISPALALDRVASLCRTLEEDTVCELVSHHACGLHLVKPLLHANGVSTVCMSIQYSIIADHVRLDATSNHLFEQLLRSVPVFLLCHLRYSFVPSEHIVFSIPRASRVVFSCRLHADQSFVLAKHGNLLPKTGKDISMMAMTI